MGEGHWVKKCELEIPLASYWKHVCWVSNFHHRI